MSYTGILSGLKTRLETLDGLVSVLTYAPTSIQDAPLMYLMVGEGEITHAAQVVTAMHDITARLIVLWVDNEEAEKEAAPYVDAVVDAVRDDPYLGGTCLNAWVTRYEGAWVTIAGVEYRAIDFTVRVKEQR